MPPELREKPEPAKPRLRVEHDDEAAVAAVKFCEQNDLDGCIRKIVAASANPGDDFADVDGKRYVATDDGVVQVAIERGGVYELLHHSCPDFTGDAERRLDVHRPGKWRDAVLSRAATIKVRPIEKPARKSLAAFERYDG